MAASSAKYAAAAGSAEIPALDRLVHLGTVTVDQQGSGFKGNKYTVHSEGQLLFNLKEDGHAFTFLNHGKTRGFHMDGVDNNGRHIFVLRRPGVLMSDKVELHMGGKVVSIVRKEPTLMTPVFNINNAHDVPTLRLKGEVTDYDFQLQTMDKTNIGSINKKFRGILQEMFTYTDSYAIRFPTDLDVRFKLAVIAACVLIDYRYHER
uniref:Phospholipid scramblase n=1 Tax=Spodoptera frugiperda TaxID=7108 RepID=A0A2H1VYI8_SPOFR